MKLRFISKLVVCIFSLILSVPAFSTVIYQFDFSNLTNMGDGEVRDPFSITLTYDDYVTEVGLKPIIGSPKATTLGYSVAYTGTNNVGWWAFDDNGAGKLTSNGYTFACESFLAYFPSSNITNFITSADTYFGFVLGAAPFGFTGDVLLTVTDSSNVPEPSTLLLLVLGLSGLLICRKKAT